VEWAALPPDLCDGVEEVAQIRQVVRVQENLEAARYENKRGY
jgi:hypothetical protein